MNIIIRNASLSDAKGIAETHARSFTEGHRDFMSEESLHKVNINEVLCRWNRRLTQPNTYTFVAEHDHKILGFLYLVIHKIDINKIKEAEILYLYIHPNYWRKGIGKQLVKTTKIFLQELKIERVFAWVLKSNPNSRSFYESLGAKTDNVEQTIEMLGANVVQIRYIFNLKI